MLNGRRPERKEIEQFMFAITDSEVLKSSGGYLFKSCFLDGVLYIGIKAAISEGERLHHYDIQVPKAKHI